MIDALMRRLEGVYEFTEDEKCILRISRSVAREPQHLGDGVTTKPGDALIDLHLWNEHLPVTGPRGPDMSWAASIQQHLAHSLALLAAYIETHRELASVKAVRGKLRFVKASDRGKLARFAARAGFEVKDHRVGRQGPRWLDGLHNKLSTWAFIHAFNPGAALDGERRATFEVWISIPKLVDLYLTDTSPTK